MGIVRVRLCDCLINLGEDARLGVVRKVDVGVKERKGRESTFYRAEKYQKEAHDSLPDFNIDILTVVLRELELKSFSKIETMLKSTRVHTSSTLRDAK